MADLNSMIARGYQFQPEPDPFVQYGQMQQLEQNRQTNALNQMKMQEMQRGMETTNALNRFLPGLNESNRSQLLGYGPAGQGVYKTLAEGDKERRLAEQAQSQANLNKSNILKNVVAQTRDAVARLDPNNAAGYTALRKSVLDQYPELTVHMPEAFNAEVQQRLLATAASVLEGQKPNIAPINAKDYTPESLQAYLNSKNPASLVAVPTKAASPFAKIDLTKFTPDSLRAYGLSGQVGDLVPVAAKADKPTSLINQIDASKFTPASVSKFAASQDYADLEPVAVKADKPASLVNQIDASKFTPASVAAFSTGGNYSLLVPVAAAKTDRTIANVNPNDFTSASLEKFSVSGKYSDLVPVAKPVGPAASKPLTAAQDIKRRDTVGKEFKSATSALQTTQDVLDSIAFVKSEPGLSQATGFTGMLPSFPDGGAASADVRLANLKGKVTALGKAAAAASGNIGSIATVEWKILADQIANIDPVKGTRPLLNQLDLIEQQAQGAMRRIQDGYERQFGEDFERFPQFSDLPPPKSAIKPKTPTASGTPAAAQGTGGFKYLGKEGSK